MFDLLKINKKNFILKFILKILFRFDQDNFFFPKIFKIDVKISKINSDFFTNYHKKFKKNKYSNTKNLFQSVHDIHKIKDFVELRLKIEEILNKKIKNFFLQKNVKGVFKIKSMWFVIMKKDSIHRIHIHPKSTLSGIFYFKVKKNTGGKTTFLIPNFNKKFYDKLIPRKYTSKKTNLIILKKNNVVEKKILQKKEYILEPRENNMVIFNSYLFHGVKKYNYKKDRISIAWDAVYTL